ncbi:MAG: alpha/beta hydrolase [Burkholderiales bacterium]|nr:alpha/beta hydrolase [Burkholderiales bacterium]
MSAIVYRHFDLPSLEIEYDNRGKVSPSTLEGYRSIWRAGSTRARETLECFLDVEYGSSPEQRLDVFLPRESRRKGPRPVCIYIHGGYWHFGDKSDCSYVALGLGGHDLITVVIKYGLAPAVPVGKQVSNCVHAVQWVQHHIERYGGDPERIYVIGHSAGAHLATMTVAGTRGTAAPRLGPDAVRGIVALSGVYELAPVALTALNDQIGLSDRDIELLSPSLLGCNTSAEMLVGVGSLEGEEFIRQTEHLAENWSKHTPRLKRKIYASDDHFSIRTGFVDPDSPLCNEVIDLMSRN